MDPRHGQKSPGDAQLIPLPARIGTGEPPVTREEMKWQLSSYPERQ
jgi:hypothetical protein